MRFIAAGLLVLASFAGFSRSCHRSRNQTLSRADAADVAARVPHATR